jgi:hypothetical protein
MASEGTMITMSFVTAQDLPENGIIEILTPSWTKIFNEDARVME